jgi:hypothetical protein
VALKGGLRDNRIYAIIAVFVIIVIILAVLFSGRDLFPARISHDFWGDDWSEDISERTSSSALFGLESSVSFKYVNNNNSFPAYVTVTTMKTFFMMSEEELNERTIETIKKASKENFVINYDTHLTGERVLKKGHRTMYVTYNASNIVNNISEKTMIIGESWNCGVSGTSVICIGVARVTNNSKTNTSFWQEIVRDKQGSFGTEEGFIGSNGLIYNVECH